uniref:GT-2 factor n=1 Tax=Rhizophora mucronata TaxID=61149 RepID=A0A2P2L671_RHIMU
MKLQKVKLAMWVVVGPILVKKIEGKATKVTGVLEVTGGLDKRLWHS